MEMPESLILRKIINQNVYCDERSEERHITGVLKRKYKLAGNIIKLLEVYAFFVITKERTSCNRYTTIEVEQKHWENKVSKYLNEPKSYIDLHKVEALSSDELCKKIRDNMNQFLIVARLCDDKYSELKDLRCNIHKCGGFVTTEKIALANLAIQDIVDMSSISDTILEKLGLD